MSLQVFFSLLVPEMFLVIKYFFVKVLPNRKRDRDTVLPQKTFIQQ